MTPSSPITVLVVNDQAAARASLRQCLAAAREIEVVGEADCGEAALERCDQLRPAVVLMSVILPGLDGLTVTQMIARRYPNTRVLVVAGFQDDSLIPIALRAGAAGYLDRGAAPAEVVEAVRAAAVGLSILSVRAAEAMARQCEPVSGGADQTGGRSAHERDLEAFYALTHRERQVLRLVLLGYTSAEIGSRLFISPRTAEKHRANMMNKLGVRNQYDLTRLAYRVGALPAEDESFVSPPREKTGKLLAFQAQEGQRPAGFDSAPDKRLSARA